MMRPPTEALIAITYRCNAKCHMCNTWKFQTKPEEEITPSDLESLPDVSFCNLTGGEPFIREDIGEFLDVLRKKAKRIVISTNGFFTDRIIKIAEKYPGLGIRVSIEGLPAANDSLRGIQNGFDHGLRTLLELHRLHVKDIGFGITASDQNILDLTKLYELSKAMRLEFATAVVHNTYYFHKYDNEITAIRNFDREFTKLISDMLRSGRVKDWFRAYFNYGLLNFAHGGERFLPCEVGSDLFFMDPFGNIKPCNGIDINMGNIKEESFAQLWNGPRANEVRKAVTTCKKQCWMIGSVAPAMKKRLKVPIAWILRNKFKLLLGRELELCL